MWGSRAFIGNTVSAFDIFLFLEFKLTSKAYGKGGNVCLYALPAANERAKVGLKTVLATENMMSMTGESRVEKGERKLVGLLELEAGLAKSPANRLRHG